MTITLKCGCTMDDVKVTKAEAKKNHERAIARAILDPDNINFMCDLARHLAQLVLR